MSGLLLTFAEAAAELAVSPRTVRRLVERGELPVTRIGRARRIPRAALVELVERSTTVAAGEHERRRTRRTRAGARPGRLLDARDPLPSRATDGRLP